MPMIGSMFSDPTIAAYQNAQNEANRRGTWRGVTWGPNSSPGQGAFGSIGTPSNSWTPGGPDPIHSAMDLASNEANRIANLEDANQREQNAFYTGEFNNFANTPAISDAEINQRFGMAAEKAGQDANTAYGNLRESLGGGGFTGATGAGLGSQIEMARMGQLTGAARDLRLYKAKLDSDKALQRLQAAGELAGFRNQSPSMVRLDALGGRAGLEVTLEGIRAGERAAREAGRSQERAGKSSMFGSAIGGIFSAI